MIDLYTEQVNSLFKDLGIKLDANRSTSPIYLTKIVSAFRLKVVYMTFDNDVSGMLMRSRKGNYIALNVLHSYNRKRFSMGHEFGHYCLGHPADVSTLLSSDRTSQVEVEANKFSSCILMPQQLIAGLAKQDMCIQELAKWLRVSEIAAAIRCRELGYRVYEADEIISQYWLERGDADNPEWSMEQLAVANV